MAFFWPLRNKGEPAETQEDPYDDNNQKPKRLRKESSSSDDSETKKHFGHISGSSSDSSDSEGEGDAKKIEEITEVNDEEDEYEVKYERFYRFDLRDGTNIKSNCFIFLPFHRHQKRSKCSPLTFGPPIFTVIGAAFTIKVQMIWKPIVPAQQRMNTETNF